MSTPWLTLLAGGVGGAIVSGGIGEWRLWRTNRREDQYRFTMERLLAAGELSRLAGDAQRCQLRRITLGRRDPVDPAAVAEADLQYQSVVEQIAAAAARFELLFPQPERAALANLLDRLDETARAIDEHTDARDELTRLSEEQGKFTRVCRKFLVRVPE